ncbi:MAG TPA: hypothetical protein VIN08_11460 [Ohtaekwangia sp.]|uniref:hypothetical protein n=1 Tax=Ohtaekwangia sp. TaxID=2066019 RepID=UPI002F92E34A
MVRKTYLYGGLQIFIVFLISVYVESVASKDLLFTDGILDDSLRKKIIDTPIAVLLYLGILNFLFFVLSHKTKENKELQNLYNNICQLMFDQFIRPNTTLENSKFRVSLFKAQKGILFRRSKYFIPEYRIYLKNLGRFQTRQEKKYCKIKFLPGEGAVGKCYTIGEITFDDIIKYSKTSENEYYKQQAEVLTLPAFKTSRLHDKSSSFICCPIKYFRSDELFGVIVVDCLEPKAFKREDFRTIEEIVLNYSVFFTNNGA